MPPLLPAHTHSSLFCAVQIGGWISICGLFTFTFKTKLYLSEPLLCVVFGILAGPNALGWLTPLDWTGGDQHTLNDVTFEVVRIVIGIQVYVLLSGVAQRGEEMLPMTRAPAPWLDG